MKHFQVKPFQIYISSSLMNTKPQLIYVGPKLLTQFAPIIFMFDMNVVDTLPCPAINIISFFLFFQPRYCTVYVLLGSLILLSFLKSYKIFSLFFHLVFLGLPFSSLCPIGSKENLIPRYTYLSSLFLKAEDCVIRQVLPCYLKKNLQRKSGLPWNIQMQEILNIKINISLNMQLLSTWTMCVEHLTWSLAYGKYSENDDYYHYYCFPVTTSTTTTTIIISSFQTQGLDSSFLLSWAGVTSWCQYRGTPLALVWLCSQGRRSRLLKHFVYK